MTISSAQSDKWEEGKVEATWTMDPIKQPDISVKDIESFIDQNKAEVCRAFQVL